MIHWSHGDSYCGNFSSLKHAKRTAIFSRLSYDSFCSGQPKDSCWLMSCWSRGVSYCDNFSSLKHTAEALSIHGICICLLILFWLRKAPFPLGFTDLQYVTVRLFNKIYREQRMLISSLLGYSLRPGLLLTFRSTKLSRGLLCSGTKLVDQKFDLAATLSEGSWRRATLDARPRSAWLLFGLCACLSTAVVSSPPNRIAGCSAYIEPTVDDQANGGNELVRASHGKPVYTNYSVIGIPGDGRCLFRAITYGEQVRRGRAPPNESLQREHADILRGKVVDELIRRREETEWFIEGDFDTYTKRMRQPHVWGGEPELLMASHVLKMPITVYMFEEQSRGLISIAEYGEEYGKGNISPIRVLYHGFGHYDALKFPNN